MCFDWIQNKNEKIIKKCFENMNKSARFVQNYPSEKLLIVGKSTENGGISLAKIRLFFALKQYDCAC